MSPILVESLSCTRTRKEHKMMNKMIISLALAFMAATVTAQTQVLTNPEFDGCLAGTVPRAATPWTGAVGTLSFGSYPAIFTNAPPGDSCFMTLSAGLSPIVQTGIVLDTSLPFDFEMLAGCTGTGGTCTFTLSINDVNVPLTGGVLTMGTRVTFSSVTANDIAISTSPATLKITYTPSVSAAGAIAHATLTSDPDKDKDGVPNSRDNCPTVANPNQADYNQDGEGDACECFPDQERPTIECRPSLTVTLSVAPFSSTVLPTTPVSFATDNCGPPSLSLDKTVFTLRDTVGPVSVTATAIDGNSKTASCPSSVFTRMVGSILTNAASSLLSLPRGVQTTLTWTSNVASFSSSDTVTIKVVSLAGAAVATVVNGVSLTDGRANVVFSASLSNASTFRLNIFLNNIPAGSHTIKFA